jgi:hypothetical protein
MGHDGSVSGITVALPCYQHIQALEYHEVDRERCVQGAPDRGGDLGHVLGDCSIVLYCVPCLSSGKGGGAGGGVDGLRGKRACVRVGES